jgi:hypothetical protein
MQTPIAIPLWHAFEHTFTSARSYENPTQDVRLRVTLYAPSGRVYDADGGATWRWSMRRPARGSRFRPVRSPGCRRRAGSTRALAHCSRLAARAASSRHPTAATGFWCFSPSAKAETAYLAQRAEGESGHPITGRRKCNANSSSRD